MNFVDALRLAGGLQGQTPLGAPQPSPTAATGHSIAPISVAQPELSEEEAIQTTVFQEQDGTSVVRLELRLNAEQTYALVKTAMGYTHRYLTLREAASYLRLRTAALTDLAAAGKIPGFQIDGHWRFEKSAIDKWAHDSATGTNSTENAA